MAFEAGKHYPNRNGEFIGPLEAYDDARFPWCKWIVRDPNALYGMQMYSEGGSWADSIYVNDRDLLDEDALKRIMSRYKTLDFNDIEHMKRTYAAVHADNPNPDGLVVGNTYRSTTTTEQTAEVTGFDDAGHPVGRFSDGKVDVIWPRRRGPWAPVLDV